MDKFWDIFTLRPSDLITTLTYVLIMDKFFPYFFIFQHCQVNITYKTIRSLFKANFKSNVNDLQLNQKQNINKIFGVEINLDLHQEE